MTQTKKHTIGKLAYTKNAWTGALLRNWNKSIAVFRQVKNSSKHEIFKHKRKRLYFRCFSYILHKKSEENAEKYENKNKKQIIVWKWNKKSKKTARSCTIKEISAIFR